MKQKREECGILLLPSLRKTLSIPFIHGNEPKYHGNLH
jgi:hypothetical protein